MKIFKERNITVQGKVLTNEEFLRTTYWDKTPPVPERMTAIIQKAEEYLDTEIPAIPLSTYRSFFSTGSRQPYVSLQNVRRDMVLILTLA